MCQQIDINHEENAFDINDEFGGSCLMKSDTEDSSKSVFMYIKDNSLLKQANYFLEKEKETLIRQVERLNVKCDEYEEKIESAEQEIRNLERELSEKDEVIIRNNREITNLISEREELSLHTQILGRKQQTIQNQIFSQSFYNKSSRVPQNYKMNKDELKSLVNLLDDTQKRRRGRTNTSRDSSKL